MRRGTRIVAVYQELRGVVGGAVPAQELLKSAESLVALFEEDETAPQFQLGFGRNPLELQDLDLAISDGGWRMLNRAWKWMGLEADDGCGGPPPEMRI